MAYRGCFRDPKDARISFLFWPLPLIGGGGGCICPIVARLTWDSRSFSFALLLGFSLFHMRRFLSWRLKGQISFSSYKELYPLNSSHYRELL